MQLDMPLEKLKCYQGSSPCPSDIDEYWKRALDELDSNEDNVTFVKSEFHIDGYEFYDMYFDGVRNGRVHCRFIKPEKIEKKVPAVLLFHGYSGYCGAWSDMLSFAATGAVVCAMDVRGQGGESHDLNPVKGNTLSGHITRGIDDDDIDNLFFRQIYLDTASVARIVMSLDYVDEANVCATGGSQGGALTVACASLVPTLKRAAFSYPFLCDYKRVWNMDMAERAYADIKQYFRNFDPMHIREDEIFTKLGYIDLQNISKNIKAECLMLTGLMDNVCPPSTQFAMYNKITAPKNVKIFYDYGHEGLRDSKDLIFDFLFNE